MDLLNALIVFSNFVFIPALAYGSQLALGALGVTLIYGILRFSNFAHGDTMAFGAMITVLATWWLQGMGVSLGPFPTAILALPFGIVLCSLFILATDRVVYRFYRKQKAKPVILVIVSMGIMFIMNGLVRFIIGPNDQRFADGERFIISVREFKQLTGLREGLAFKTTQGITIITAVLVVLILFWFLNKTRTGKSMRAYSDNEDLALLSGINPEKVVTVTKEVPVDRIVEVEKIVEKFVPVEVPSKTETKIVVREVGEKYPHVHNCRVMLAPCLLHCARIPTLCRQNHLVL